MQEILEQIIDYLKGIWIKRRYIMISTWLICPLGWFVVAQLDDVYQSDARIYADTQSILDPLLQGLTVSVNPNEQVRLKMKTLLGRPNLERIIRMADLDVQANTPKEYEKIIERLKEDIIIKKRGSYKENLYTITFEDKNPEVARNVVQSVLTVFIENTLGENRTDTDSAQKFLNTQIKDYEARLLEAESRLTNFKQKYSNILPSEAGGYYARLRDQKSKLETAQLKLKEIETSIASAKAQLDITNNNPSQSTSNNIKDATSVSTSYDERIIQLEAKLDNLLMRYTEKHPDVTETKRLLEGLKKARLKELDNYYKSLAENNSGNSSNLNALNINPVYQEIKIQVNQLQTEAASLRVRVKNYKAKVTDLENRIHTIPEIEAELVALNRGYSITKSKYEDLLNRRETAQIAQQADETTNKIQFKVIDSPRIAVEPTGPRRILLFLAVTFFGFGVGMGLSLLMSQLNSVVTSSKQLSKATGIPIFGMVSANENLSLQKWHKKKTYIFMASNLILLGILMMFISYFLFPDLLQAPLKRFF